MIGRLKGTIEAREIESVLLDVGGVVYELTCSLATLENLAVGERAVLDVYTHVREDALALFGFATKLEKELFLALLSVNGVGPKMAIKILSAAPVDHIARAIERGDVKALSALPKVGKKTAEQLIVSLKGKLAPFLERSMDSAAAADISKLVGEAAPLHDDIASALQNLGFRPQEVERVLSTWRERASGEERTFEAGLRFALQTLGGGR